MTDHSIILPVFNGASYLSEAVDSILAQDAANLELIVVDDCSTDNSREILERYAKRDERVRIFATAVNSGGPATPKNVGLAQARGRFISFCDQDDILLPHKLSLATSVFDAHPELEVVFFDSLHFSAEGRKESPYLQGRSFLKRAAQYLRWIDADTYEGVRFFGCLAGIDTGMTTQTIVARRSSFDGLQFDPRFRIVDDISVWYRLSENRRIAFHDKVVALYRHHDGALTADSTRLTLETIAFHRENYFRQRPLLNAQEDSRYRKMLSRFYVRAASMPRLSRLEQRDYLARSMVFDFTARRALWFARTFVQ